MVSFFHFTGTVSLLIVMSWVPSLIICHLDIIYHFFPERRCSLFVYLDFEDTCHQIREGGADSFQRLVIPSIRTSETIKKTIWQTPFTPDSSYSLVMGREWMNREWKEEKSKTFNVPFYPPKFHISITDGLCENMRTNIWPAINFCCNQDFYKLNDV